MTERRTQQERRLETIGKLVDATIECLAERGYADSSTSKICSRAGVSQGGMYNHFDSRLALIGRATEEICSRHIERLEEAARVAADLDGELARRLVEFMRQTSRTTEHTAWHEVMVAARTDVELRERVRPSLRSFEEALLSAVESAFDVDADEHTISTIALSLMHLFDSEAVTSTIYSNERVEEARLVWATAMLEAALESAP